MLDALEHAMPASDFLLGVVKVIQQGSQPMRRLALRLFTARLESLQALQGEEHVDSR